MLGSRSGRLAQSADLHVFTNVDCEVTLYAGDSASAETASGLLSHNDGHPVAGIMHAAGIQV